MDVQLIIVGLCVLVAVVFVGLRFRRAVKRGQCSGCRGEKSCCESKGLGRME